MTLAGAFLFRLRGGWPPLGSTFLARITYAIGFAVGAALLAEDARMLVLVAPFYFGAIFPWFNSIDLGRNEGSWEKDAALMAFRGFIFAAAPALFFPFIFGVVWALNTLFDWHIYLAPIHFGWWYAAVGFLCPFCYELGWRTMSTIRNFERGTPLGEVYFGAIMGGALAFATAG